MAKRTRKTTTTKTTTARKTSPAKTAAAATPKAPVKLAVVSEAKPTEAAAEPSVMLRKKEFIERVAARTDAKMGQVRDITEAVLAELGDALSKGETLSLSPLGKLRVNRQVERSEHEVLVVKIRRSTDGDDANDEGGEKTDTDPLAEDGQDS